MLPRLLEKSFELKTQDYEKQIWSLKEEIKALKDEKTQLQHSLEEERITCDRLKEEVARLSQQAKVEAPLAFRGALCPSPLTRWGEQVCMSPGSDS